MKANSRALISLGVLTAATVLGVAPSADACVDRYTGTFSSAAVACDTMCTGGPLTGGLAGTLGWTMDTMEETGVPNVVRYTGVNTITTDRGTLVGDDVGYWNLVTGDFVDYTQWTSGTGEFEGAVGNLTIIGKFDPVTGAGSSRYISFVKTP